MDKAYEMYSHLAFYVRNDVMGTYPYYHGPYTTTPKDVDAKETIVEVFNGLIDISGKELENIKQDGWKIKPCEENLVENIEAAINKAEDEITGEDILRNLAATDYSVFPEDANTGYPCRPDEESTDATKDTRSLGALEMFYVGYLIDRDGPINAVASFFEVKVAALRNNLSLLSKKITALNTYLDFINRGMDVLNQSQSNGKKRIPDGAVIALTYLCGQKMYNLFEASNGNKYVVVPSVRESGAYILVKADESGKRFLMGDDGSNGTGNGSCGIDNLGFEGGWYMVVFNSDSGWGHGNPPLIKDGGDLSKGLDGSFFKGYGMCAKEEENGKHKEGFSFYPSSKGDKLEGTFKLPTQLEVNLIIPGSVKRYTAVLEDEELEDNEHTSMIESWTNAFSNKTQYINTAIDTINTDVTVDRSKIDTFDSLTSTFRSRAHDAYTNIASNIRG